MSTYDTRSSQMGSRDTVIEMRDATVTFDMDRGESRVLDHVDFDVDRNEILGIVGESGSGKSMFASALLDAVVDPGQLSGEITYYPEEGEPKDVLNLSEAELRRLRWEEISMVFQGAMSSFNPTLDLRGHFEETLRAHDSDVEAGMERARELLSDLYIDPDRVLDSYPHELSGGMQQRALIALSLVLKPEVLVMDEPTAALDLLMQRSILRLLEKLQEKYDLTLVFITHDLPLVAELADRLAVMYAFQLVEVGETEDVLENAAHPYTRALLNATPNLGASLDTMRPVEGSSPDPVAVPEGCSYHPRCPLADAQCKTEDPAYRDVNGTHQSACHHWGQAIESIPLNADAASGDADHGAASRTRRAKGDQDVVLSLEDLEVAFEQSSGWNPFADPETVTAVDGVSLDVPENEVVALVGESGCGKTTLGKTAIGLQKPTGGSVKYRGQDIWESGRGGESTFSRSEIRKSLQIIHQDPGSSLNPYRKVMKILEEPLKKWHDSLSRADRRARIHGMLETVGMTPPEDFAGRYPHQLSGGEQQRVALVRALLMNPDVILADEAISALDVSLRIEMMDLFLDLQEQFDTSFLFISHDLSNARYLAEKSGGRIGIMYLGELVEIGPAEEIIKDPRHPYTKALHWATPDLNTDADGDVPVSEIDIPDPVDPPSGCRFHTRCPEAREVCQQEKPCVAEDGDRAVACFREVEDHAYWDSEPLAEEE